ncbi:hypothetical protein C1646_804242 [Rhizophagus diaphanus]|nr:hypothetical protein C1646_804242 [Rhizophagus diaphanus] [Rhizophagus sp. MUCL 43196]
MYFSLNCLLLGEEFNNSFSVNIGATTENYEVNYDDIKVSHIKSLVFDRKSYKLKSLNINNSDSLELWKVDSKKIENNENKLEGFSTKDDIKNYLGGEYMESQHFLSRYFIKYKVIDRRPFTSSCKCPPLERNMESAIKSISNNFEQSFFTKESVAKSTLDFLVCSGAPGIVKGWSNSIYLPHIDEIQLMFKYEKYWSEETKEFTKRLLHVLAQYTMNNKTFIQTFLSGTTLREVVKLKELTGYNFNYIICPLLSMDACIEIVNDFAVKQNDINYQWTLDRTLVKILEDACGLPRAIEYFLDDLLKIDYFKNRNWKPSGFFFSIAYRNLRGIAYLEHKFLIKYKDLYCKNAKKSYNWKEAIIFKNAALAEFGNSFVRYWIWGKKFQSPMHLNEIIHEHKKNLAALERCDSEKIRKQRIITILFTTRTIDSDLLYSFRSTIPDDILLVCRDNFYQHFGKLFASQYGFELLSVNVNYTSPDTLEGILGTAIKDSPRDLLLKRPFRSPKDFKDRVAFKDGVTFDSDEEYGINAKICRLSYAPFQKRKVPQTQELLFKKSRESYTA